MFDLHDFGTNGAVQVEAANSSWSDGSVAKTKPSRFDGGSLAENTVLIFPPAVLLQALWKSQFLSGQAVEAVMVPAVLPTGGQTVIKVWPSYFGASVPEYEEENGKLVRTGRTVSASGSATLLYLVGGSQYEGIMALAGKKVKITKATVVMTKAFGKDELASRKVYTCETAGEVTLADLGITEAELEAVTDNASARQLMGIA